MRTRAAVRHWQEGPDFLTFARGRMWVEVKALDPPMSQQLLDSAWKNLKKRLEGFEGQYRIDDWVSPAFDSSVAKQAMKLLAGEPVNGAAPGSDFYVGIPAAMQRMCACSSSGSRAAARRLV